MEQRSSPFRVLLGPPLVAMAFAAVIAYWLTDDTPQPASAPAATPSPAPPSPAPAPVKPAAEVVRPKLPPSPSAPTPAPAAPAPAAEPASPDLGPKENAFRRLAEPKMREHAQLMAIESAKMSLKNRDLMGLNRLHTTLRTEGIEQAISPNDLAAMDIGIECLSKAPNAKQRVFEFLEDNASTPLGESLREACQ